ncbi:hypothetical protein, partial [Sphingobium sp.]|uniref:hypothetical protein n=1 Tax=Sphingobium sp. TaxID=1912891 RepID=UPI002B742300
GRAWNVDRDISDVRLAMAAINPFRLMHPVPETPEARWEMLALMTCPLFVSADSLNACLHPTAIAQPPSSHSKSQIAYAASSGAHDVGAEIQLPSLPAGLTTQTARMDAPHVHEMAKMVRDNEATSLNDAAAKAVERAKARSRAGDNSMPLKIAGDKSAAERLYKLGCRMYDSKTGLPIT